MVNMVKSEIIEAIKRAGVVGAGGAGFPTHVKAGSTVDLVLANGAECEPLLATDKTIMARYPEKLVNGLRIMMHAVGARRGVICTKAKYKEAVDTLAKVVARHPDIRLHLVDDFYPSGDEQVMVHEVSGRVVPEGGIPLDVGVVVSNVATLVDVDAAVTGSVPVTERTVTVAGAVQEPSVLRVAIGTPVSALLEAAGGATVEHDKLRIVMGGPMMGQMTGDLRTPITKTTSGVLVIPEDHPLARSNSLPLEAQIRRARSTCCGCRTCTDLCPRNLLGHELEPHRVMRAFAEMPPEAADVTRASWATQAFLCSQCNVCQTYACQMGLSPRALLASLRSHLAAAKVTNPHRRRPAAAKAAQAWSRVPVARLRSRLGADRLEAPLPPCHDPIHIQSDQVTIPLRQHVGVPSEPLVKPGSRVHRGQLIAAIPAGKLGANIHSSIDGTVTSVANGEITIDGAAS